MIAEGTGLALLLRGLLHSCVRAMQKQEVLYRADSPGRPKLSLRVLSVQPFTWWRPYYRSTPVTKGNLNINLLLELSFALVSSIPQVI